MKYFVEITETLQRLVEVDAEDENEAYCDIYNQYRRCAIVLGDNDYSKTDIKVFRTTEDGKCDYDEVLM